VIRLYADGNGGLRFARKNAKAKRLAARAILTDRRSFEERLHAHGPRRGRGRAVAGVACPLLEAAGAP
jgi:hypothetical protein